MVPASATALFRPLKAAEAVARDIVRDIIAQGLAPGDPLPNEAFMIEQYRVSRESLREGLRLLETQGLIVIRRGPRGGPLVGVVDPANLGRVATLYYEMAGATYQELLDAWLLGEVLLAERAARNPDGAARLERMAPYVHEPPDDPEGLDEFVGMHSSFHGILAQLAGNRVLELTLQSYGLVVSHHAARVNDPRHLSHVLSEDHFAIAQAVIAGQPKKARDAMQRHIEAVIADTRERLGDRVNDPVEWR
ncbi:MULTISPECIES: FadR/GntR family transcriptional regulator [unclassified Blastococcus]